MTREIRLLTGRHAGARIRLNPTLTRIGNDDGADIQISDWDLPTMHLSYHDDGRVSIAGPAMSGAATMLDDFVPQRFGNIVLCVGDADAAWPSDIALLETLLAPAPVHEDEARGAATDVAAIEPAAATLVTNQLRTRRGARNVGLAVAALLAVGCAGIALPAVLQPRAADVPHGGILPTANILQGMLARLQMPDIELKQQDGRFLVVGIVPDTASDAMLRNALERIAPGQLVWRIGSVDQITRDMQESLHDPALSVRYLGHREFAVSGISKNTSAARQMLEQISGDLAPMVTRIALQFTPDDRMAPPSDVESLLAVDGLQYVVSSDGTKHFVDTHVTPNTAN